jgi:hypothetical protein
MEVYDLVCQRMAVTEFRYLQIRNKTNRTNLFLLLFLPSMSKTNESNGSSSKKFLFSNHNYIDITVVVLVKPVRKDVTRISRATRMVKSLQTQIRMLRVS